MSRTPRRPRHLGRHRPPVGRAQDPAPSPAGGLRGLVEEGIIVAAALNARDDLELAAASTHRLGGLTSGMWRALSRELATAAERLDRSTMERLEDIERRSRALEVDADEVVTAGVAAMHLGEHRDTLVTLLQPDDDAQRFLAPDMLLGFGIDSVDTDEPSESATYGADDETDREDDIGDPDGLEESEVLSVRVTMLLWPAPLTSAAVTIRPLLPDDTDASENAVLDLGLSAPSRLLEALTAATGFSSERVSHALSSLGVACWTAHHLDDQPPDEADEGETDDDVDADGGPVGG